MGIYKDKERGHWRFSFEYKKTRYTGRGFDSRRSAERASLLKRKELLLKNNSIAKQKNADISDVDDYYSFLSSKYKSFLSSPNNTIPDLVDMFFKDFNLPSYFKGWGHRKKKSKNTL